MKHIRLVLSFFFMVLCLTAQASGDEEEWTFDVDTGYAFGQYIGLDQNYGEIGVLVACPSFSSWDLFSQMNGYWLQDNQWAASVGIGVRRTNCSGRQWGVNFFYDGRKGCRSKIFNRLGIGAELLSRCFDFRINGYLPFEQRHTCSTFLYDQYIGDYFWKRSEREFAFKGVDAEIGRRLWDVCDFSLYGALGPYYYYNKQVGSFVGGFARLELNWLDYLSCIVRISYDKENRTRVQGELVATIPLYQLGSNVGCSCSLSYVPVQRNPVIFTKRCRHLDWNW
jgi:hypothetical protein